jgi:hypothetical protein
MHFDSEMPVIERCIAAPVTRVGNRQRDIVAEEIDSNDLPLPRLTRYREQAFAG